MPVPCIIPDPGGPLLCGTAFTGQAICGQARAADTYADFVIALPQGTAEVIVVEFSSPTLELVADPPTVTTGVVITVTDSDVLDLLGDVGGSVTYGVTITSPSGAIELDGFSPVGLVLGADLVLPDSLPLQLDGDDGVMVNPILMTFKCEPLDVAGIDCTPLDLVAAVAEEQDLVPLACGEPA